MCRGMVRHSSPCPLDLWDSEELFSSLSVWRLVFNEPLETVLKDGVITLVVSSLSVSPKAPILDYKEMVGMSDFRAKATPPDFHDLVTILYAIFHSKL